MHSVRALLAHTCDIAIWDHQDICMLKEASRLFTPEQTLCIHQTLPPRLLLHANICMQARLRLPGLAANLLSSVT